MKMNPKMALVIGSKMGPPKPYDAPDEPEDHDFPAPEGMDMDGKKQGEMMEVVCTLEVKDNGMLCVRKVNGMEVPGYDDKDKPMEDKEKPSSDSFTDAAMPEDEAGGDEQEAM